MDKFLMFFNSIDWVFAAIVLIGGRYWGRKYFRISKNPDLNFLAFATLFGAIWILIKWTTGDYHTDNVASLFITYLFVTSFYQLLAKKFFEMIERWAGVSDVSTLRDDVIVEEYKTQSFFPQVGTDGIWYYDQTSHNYFYWDGGKYVNKGGDRPTDPPIKP